VRKPKVTFKGVARARPNRASFLAPTQATAVKQRWDCAGDWMYEYEWVQNEGTVVFGWLEQWLLFTAARKRNGCRILPAFSRRTKKTQKKVFFLLLFWILPQNPSEWAENLSINLHALKDFLGFPTQGLSVMRAPTKVNWGGCYGGLQSTQGGSLGSTSQTEVSQLQNSANSD
jgi:hypothetical protein